MLKCGVWRYNILPCAPEHSTPTHNARVKSEASQAERLQAVTKDTRRGRQARRKRTILCPCRKLRSKKSEKRKNPSVSLDVASVVIAGYIVMWLAIYDGAAVWADVSWVMWV